MSYFAEYNSYIYAIQDHSGHIKIGYTGNVPVRLKALQGAHAKPLILLAAVPGTPADEETLHVKLSEARLSGEWFEPTPEVKEAVRKMAQKQHAAEELLEMRQERQPRGYGASREAA